MIRSAKRTADDLAQIQIIERDLAARAAEANVDERKLIEAIAGLAFGVCRLDLAIEAHGADQPTIRYYISMSASLMRSLHAFGPDKAGGTLAEAIAARSCAVADALLAAVTPAGRA